MAVVGTLLTEGTGGTASSHTTASITPSANALILATVHIGGGSLFRYTSGVTGCGLTWVNVSQIAYYADVIQNNSDGAIECWRAMGSSPTTGGVTFTYYGSNTGAQWIVTQWTGVATSGTNGSGAIGATGTAVNVSNTPSVTLSAAPALSSVVYGSFSGEVPTSTWTPGSGFTQIGTTDPAALDGRFDEYCTGTTSTAVTASRSVSNGWGGIAFEILRSPAAIGRWG